MTVNGADLDLTPSQVRRLPAPEIGSGFDVDDRMFASWGDNEVFSETDWSARDMREMLRRDGTAKKLEQVLSLPIRGAGHELVGKGGPGKFVRDTLGPKLDLLIEQATSAGIYRRAYFEKIWASDGDRIVYERLAWRPPGSCEAAFTATGARPDGFRQRTSHHTLNATTRGLGDDRSMPGYVRIPAIKAWVHTHGAHREPVHGVSDLDVCLWAYETRQKLLFLWFQFLENQSLPKLAAYGDSLPQAIAAAEALAAARASGIVPFERPNDPQARAFDVIESAGQGAAQFLDAIRYLEQQQTNSVLAGFTDLASAASNGRGSNALSADQSEFFLGSRQAVADDIARSITEHVIRPLVVLNFGADADVPRLEIGPIGNAQTSRALELLTPMLTAQTVQAPPEFVDMLLTRTAAFVGLDADALQGKIEQWRAVQAEQAVTATPPEGGVPDPELSAAVTLAHRLVAAVKTGTDPADALAAA